LKGKDKIKRLTLVSDYSDGGLKMPHLESTIKVLNKFGCIHLEKGEICWRKFLKDLHNGVIRELERRSCGTYPFVVDR